VHEKANGEDTHDVQQRHIEALRQQRDMLQQMVEQRKQVRYAYVVCTMCAPSLVERSTT
jgi:hypothetical protein